MIELDYKTHPELYVDYRKCLDFLSTIDESQYEYPEEKTNFHIYTEIKNDKELECIKSFLATQNLEKTHLIVWSDYSIEYNPLIQPYKEYLDLRVWDAVEESKGTILEGELKKLRKRDKKFYAQSDLLRILALHKYGGVWVDMDVVFLRDFKPLLNQEYMYQWGSETDFASEGACATVLSLKKNSDFSNELMLELLNATQAHGVWWGKEMFATLWARWPNFTIFPSPFFNAEWLISKTDKELSAKVIKSWFANTDCEKDHLFLDSFAWHWHNSSHKHLKIKKGSKFDLLRDITNEKLKNKRIGPI